jgi:hypothetical protein
MDYNGTWKVYFDDNLEGFLKAMCKKRRWSIFVELWSDMVV